MVYFFAGVAQLVEQLICNQQVPGSSPGAGFENDVSKVASMRRIYSAHARGLSGGRSGVAAERSPLDVSEPQLC